MIWLLVSTFFVLEPSFTKLILNVFVIIPILLNRTQAYMLPAYVYCSHLFPYLAISATYGISLTHSYHIRLNHKNPSVRRTSTRKTSRCQPSWSQDSPFRSPPHTSTTKLSSELVEGDSLLFTHACHYSACARVVFDRHGVATVPLAARAYFDAFDGAAPRID